MSAAMEAAFCTLAIQESFVPGQAHLDEVEPEFAALRLPRTTETRARTTVLSNSSGFGGSNVALVLRKAHGR